MKILVANLGSTSFKYRLFDLPAETQLARGGIDRIGQAQSGSFVEIGGRREEAVLHVADHAAAVRICLEQLMHPQWGCLKSASEVSAIGFKAVFAGRLSGVKWICRRSVSTRGLRPVAVRNRKAWSVSSQT